MEKSSYDAVIVGAGAAGLSAARHLEQYHLKTLVIDRDSRAGGRLKTDQYQGFRLDRGFQVLLNAYPEAQRLLDMEALALKAFRPGAFCFGLSQKYQLSDSQREPWSLLRMAFSPVGTLRDKLKLARMRKEILAKSEEEIFNEPNITSLDYLQQKGFSEKIIQRFFKPFFSGIFLEPDLSTSVRMFQFVFKMFSIGDACLPAEGIEAIALQLKGGLQKTEFRFNTAVQKVEAGRVILENGEEIAAQQIILATAAAPALMPQLEGPQNWRSTQQFYFSAPRSPFAKGLIGLNIEESGLINNIADLSAVQASFAPKGRSLISVSLRQALPESEEAILRRLQDELNNLLGPQCEKWEFLRSYHIREALPQLENMTYRVAFEQCRIADGIYLAGDQLLNPSLNAALLSGELAAQALILNHRA